MDTRKNMILAILLITFSAPAAAQDETQAPTITGEAEAAIVSPAAEAQPQVLPPLEGASIELLKVRIKERELKLPLGEEPHGEQLKVLNYPKDLRELFRQALKENKLPLSDPQHPVIEDGRHLGPRRMALAKEAVAAANEYLLQHPLPDSLRKEMGARKLYSTSVKWNTPNQIYVKYMFVDSENGCLLALRYNRSLNHGHGGIDPSEVPVSMDCE
jgi:hypothetical protein